MVDEATDSDSTVATDEPKRSGARHAKPAPVDSMGRKVLRGIGQTLITLGVVVLLFIVYEVYVTDIFTAQRQNELNEQLHEEWDDPTIEQDTTFADLPIGEAFAIVRIPAFGADYAQVVLEGTDPDTLEQGPGHYPGTAMPGEVGNFAVAGHRVGKGSPFLNLDKLSPGDAVVFETKDLWYVYRVIGDPESGSFEDPAHPGVVGQSVVLPTDTDVIAPLPGGTGAEPSEALLTLTTCHPKFSAAERMIIHGYLDGDPLPKSEYPEPGDVPALKGA